MKIAELETVHAEIELSLQGNSSDFPPDLFPSSRVLKLESIKSFLWWDLQVCKCKEKKSCTRERARKLKMLVKIFLMLPMLTWFLSCRVDDYVDATLESKVCDDWSTAKFTFFCSVLSWTWVFQFLTRFFLIRCQLFSTIIIF